MIRVPVFFQLKGDKCSVSTGTTDFIHSSYCCWFASETVRLGPSGSTANYCSLGAPLIAREAVAQRGARLKLGSRGRIFAGVPFLFRIISSVGQEGWIPVFDEADREV